MLGYLLTEKDSADQARNHPKSQGAWSILGHQVFTNTGQWFLLQKLNKLIHDIEKAGCLENGQYFFN